MHLLNILDLILSSFCYLNSPLTFPPHVIASVPLDLAHTHARFAHCVLIGCFWGFFLAGCRGDLWVRACVSGLWVLVGWECGCWWCLVGKGERGYVRDVMWCCVGIYHTIEVKLYGTIVQRYRPSILILSLHRATIKDTLSYGLFSATVIWLVWSKLIDRVYFTLIFFKYVYIKQNG
jgi:hypothetical protein